MKIIRASSYGFCSGVERALKIAYEALSRASMKGIPCYLYGEIIHNDDVNEELLNMGMKFFTEESLPPGIVVIRAHGIPAEKRKEIEGAGFEIADATCPIVSRAASLLRNAASPVIAGNPKHPEVIMLRSMNREARVIEDPSEIGRGEYECVVQSTIPDDFYEGLRKSGNIKLLNGPCGASRRRRDSVREILSEIDALVVLGSEKSANAKALLKIAENAGKKAYLVSEEIPTELYTHEKIGVTAAASVPKEDLDKFIDRINGK